MEENELNTIRAELREAIETASLRSVARDLGLSPSGLSKVIAGANPYAKTGRKLRAWYQRREPGGREREINDALQVLLRDLDPEAREKAADSIRRTIDEQRRR